MSSQYRFKRQRISEELKDLFLTEQNAYNFRQIRNIAMVLIFVSLVFILQHIYYPVEGRINTYDSIYIRIFVYLMLSSFLFLGISRFIRLRLSGGISKFLMLFYIVIVVFLLISLTYFDLHFGHEITGFIFVLMYLSTILWLYPREYAILSGFSIFLLILSYLILEDIVGIEFYQYIQGGLFYGVGWVLYLSINSIRIENFLNRVSLEERYEMLETESATDPLTGLYNRRHMKEELQKELARSERSENPFCIVLLDIDHFKRVNDSYGHITGDDVIREMADILRNSVRLSDKVFRYGGEEYIILLPETQGRDAYILGERIREKIETFSFSGVRRKITVSMGIAQSHSGSSLELLMQKADKRLYHAKQTGRNRVIWNNET